MIRPIAISLSPNLESKDALIALRLLLSPWRFFAGSSVKLLEQWFRQSFLVSHAITFNSGRGALFGILRALDVGNGDEVALQSFTCVAIPNSVIATGAKPIYVDINDSLTIDAEDLERKITKRTKAIIIQHTFGIPANLEKIKKIARKHKLFIIEDCAHAIDILYQKKKLGTFGDVSFFSFGRDKKVSSVFGGIAITNNEIFGKKLREFQRKLKYPSFFWTAQQLFHPIAFFFLVLPFYNFFSLGKIMLIIFQKMRLLSLPVSSAEKQGMSEFISIKKLPNSLACLALFQLKRIKEFNHTREIISKKYIEELNQPPFILPCKKTIPFLRFPVFVDKRDDLLKFLRRHGVYLGKWYSEVIDPKGVFLKNIFYQKGSCPKAEFFAKKVINLPTYPTMTTTDVQKVIQLLKQYAQNKLLRSRAA